MQWGDRWLREAETALVQLRHRDCGGEVRAVLYCGAGNVPLNERQVEARAGPGTIRTQVKSRAGS